MNVWVICQTKVWFCESAVETIMAEIMKINDCLILSSAIRLSLFISLNFDFLGDEDTKNNFSQAKGEKFISQEFEFDLNSLY